VIWGEQEVIPVLERLRADGVGLDLRDVQLYATALAARDRLGCDRWPGDLAGQLGMGAQSGRQRGLPQPSARKAS
jgi:hypothetical protein